MVNIKVVEWNKYNENYVELTPLTALCPSFFRTSFRFTAWDFLTPPIGTPQHEEKYGLRFRFIVLFMNMGKFSNNDGFKLTKKYATNSPPVGGVAIAGVGSCGEFNHKLPRNHISFQIYRK